VALYEFVVKGNDPIGFNFIENIIKLANLGATKKESQLPKMSFPHTVYMELEADKAPDVANASIRVFNMSEGGTEVLPGAVEAPVVKGGFSLEVAKEKMSKEELEALSWDDFKAEVKRVTDQTGRDRKLLTSTYLNF
jgi:hypothetical protein